MVRQISVVKGMNDIHGEAVEAFDYLVSTTEVSLRQYGYSSIRLPIVEKTELFKRSIGEVTDIVEKEMYTFEGRNGESLTLRPEGTVGCVRAVVQNGLVYNQIQKLFYIGAMFRYERPQKGRYRQFHQIGVEAFGIATPDVDAELIILTAKIWEKFGLENLELQINSLGSQATRANYKDKLVTYLLGFEEQLDEDSVRRLETNPLRILDSKNPDMKSIIDGAPKLLEYLDEESQVHFKMLKSYLDDAGIAYIVNPNLVRGLDYYNRTVFEWVTTELGAQGTVCAGGRYDYLVEQIGGKAIPAVGFAMGIERLAALLMTSNKVPAIAKPDLYVVLVGEGVSRPGMVISEMIRDTLLGINVQMNCGGGSFKSQFKKADKSGARYAIILGEQEVADKVVAIKSLREKTEQQTVAWDDLIVHLQTLLTN